MNCRKGSILILVLFVMVVLSMVAVSFSYRTGLETRLVRHQSVMTRLRMHASSAVAIALAQLMANMNDFDHSAETWHSHQPLNVERWLPEWSQDETGSPPAYVTDYQVIDEEGKLNLLFASSEALEALGMSSGRIASLFDWMDVDDIAQAEGAEDGYYQHLSNPYRCKNAPLEFLNELLLIRGFDFASYLGDDRDRGKRLSPSEADGLATDSSDGGDGELRPGWVDLFTCKGDGKINLNTAPAAVLDTLPLSPEAVGQIVGFRAFDETSSGVLEDHAFRSETDIDQLQGLTEADRDMLKLVGRFRSQHFRILVQSRYLPMQLEYRLDALVRMGGKRPEILQWKVW